MSAAETATYKAWQEKCSPVFQPQFRKPDYDRTAEFTGGFTAISRAYEGQADIS